jgi:hypothetical protein
MTLRCSKYKSGSPVLLEQEERSKSMNSGHLTQCDARVTSVTKRVELVDFLIAHHHPPHRRAHRRPIPPLRALVRLQQ